MVLWFVVLFIAVVTLAWGAGVKIGVVKNPSFFAFKNRGFSGGF
jgi:hypothetical protein